MSDEAKPLDLHGVMLIILAISNLFAWIFIVLFIVNAHEMINAILDLNLNGTKP